MKSKKNKTLAAYFMTIAMTATMVQAPITANAAVENEKGLGWNFDDSAKVLEGWKFGGSYAYNGPVEQVVDFDNSNKTMKLSVDYSKDSAASWSEFKIMNWFDEPISFNGYSTLKYDFIYDPSKMSTGSFQGKLFVSDKDGKEVVNVFDKVNLDNAVDIGGGLKKAKVTLKFDPKDSNISSVTMGIIGANTNYKGDIYIDNINFEKGKAEDIYVEKSVAVTKQDKVEIGDLSGKMPSQVKLVDYKAIDKTADLYAYLLGLGKTDKVLYGHQNDTHHKAILKNGADGSSNSDTKDVTGSIAAICGIDALSLTGAELQLSDSDKENGVDLINKAANLSIDTAAEGGIITLSAHMPNFAIVAEKGKDANGNYDYSGYTPGVTTGNVVQRIMPGGDLNKVYTGYLNQIARYAKQLEAKGVPVLFRPFHENNGSWFWWGKAFCDEEAYKNLYRYTVEYLRDERQVHNFLYVYSPNGPFQDKADYLSRYPGDQFIDIIAFDMYNDDPVSKEDKWLDTFKDTIDLVQGIADDRGKLSAVSETGVRVNGGGMAPAGNKNLDWFNDVSNIVSQSNMPYYMVWANFDGNKNFFAPFMADNKKGHEMINNFINYYNNYKSVFANGVGDYSKAVTKEGTASSYGYIKYPASSSRVLEQTKIMASLKNINGEVKFVIKNKGGQVIESIKGTLNNGDYTADITQDTLDKLGATIGYVELYSDDKLLDTVRILFNIKEAEKNPKLVDNFESYIGEDALLQTKWSTNAGTGCSVNPSLVQDNKNNGEYGLQFKYRISTEKTSEGWTGITKTIDADWSNCDALQFWCKPDGKGQKLVIQITSKGEDFEVFMPEFSGTTEPKLITLPFSQFKGKNNGVFDPSKIEKMGIWCNTIVPKGYTGSWTVDSAMYFDDIKAIDTKAQTGSKQDSDENVSSNINSALNGSWYYVDAEGMKVTNAWKQIEGKWYYFKQDGTVKTGWFKDANGKSYYFESNGVMKTGWFNENNKWYYLKSDGSMASNEYVNGYWLNKTGECQ
jgi:mannan endo-1,4-beta-mannosidase